VLPPQPPQPPPVTSYTITFDPQGGTVTPSQAVTGNNGRLTSLPAPARAGHTFSGWFTAASGGTRITTDTVFTANTTVFAQWTAVPPPVTYTITFDPQGGSVTPAQAVTGNNGRLTSLPTPARTGHTFNGWFTSASGGTRITTDTVFTADTTIFAQWTPMTYTVTFDLAGGTHTGGQSLVQTVVNGQNAVLPTGLQRNGYIFSHWNGTHTNITSDRTITAVWTIPGTGGFNVFELNIDDVESHALHFSGNISPVPLLSSLEFELESTWNGDFVRYGSDLYIDSSGNFGGVFYGRDLWDSLMYGFTVKVYVDGIQIQASDFWIRRAEERSVRSGNIERRIQIAADENFGNIVYEGILNDEE
jgi:uncharacterized repeat protein (TIGR02543 family)